MKKFIVLAFSAPDTSVKEEGGSMEDWETWMKDNSDNVTDMGSPLNNGVEGNGKDGFKEIKPDQWPAEGYMMIQAEDMAKAQEVMSSSPLGASTPLRIFEKVEMH